MSAVEPDGTAARLKLASLSSTSGAGVLGLGLGTLAARYLAGLGVFLVLSGLALHVWGMVDQHRIEARQAQQLWWEAWLYWICWLALGGLAVYVIGL
ncbi:MAG: hypothetical protein WEE89_16605, partial [Gemmatimonadota bacterium]